MKGEAKELLEKFKPEGAWGWKTSHKSKQKELSPNIWRLGGGQGCSLGPEGEAKRKVTQNRSGMGGKKARKHSQERGKAGLFGLHEEQPYFGTATLIDLHLSHFGRLVNGKRLISPERMTERGVFRKMEVQEPLVRIIIAEGTQRMASCFRNFWGGSQKFGPRG